MSTFARNSPPIAPAWRSTILSALLAWVVASACAPVLGGEETVSLEQRIERLIEQLGHEKYTVRERAQKELAELGFEAYDALRAAANDEDLEIASRASYLLLLIPAQWNLENEPPEVRRYLSYYQSGAWEIRSVVLNDLARLSQGTGIAALCRLVRFEKSSPWSKRAAVVLMNVEPADQAGRARWEKTLREQLGRSTRPGARWLRARLQSLEEPKQAASRWEELVKEELDVLQRSAEQTDPAIVAALLYYLALAQAEQGEQAPAEATAERARQLGTARTASRLRARIDMAMALVQRGKFRWAELEYRHVLDAGVLYPKVRAGLFFSETLHDQGDNLAAAKLLEEVLQVDKQQLEPILDRLNRTDRGIRARRAYLLSCHWAEQDDRGKQRQYLDEAVRHDPAELDALIARYQLPDKEPDFHQKTVELIAKAATSYRQTIAETSDAEARVKAMFCNQFAWLVGNTEGDLDEALRCAQKAVQLQPDAGAYFDTLAHVYFARGELESAVQSQIQAAERDPYSGLIANKLEVFQNALEQSRHTPPQKPTEGEAGKPPAEKGPTDAADPQTE